MFWLDSGAPQETQKKQTIRFIEEFTSLTRHPAWRQLHQYWEAEERRGYDSLFKATSGDMALKASTAYVTMRNMREYVDMQLRTAMQTLEVLELKK